MNSALADWGAARRALAGHAASSVVGIDRGRGVRVSGIVWDPDTVVTAAEVLHGADSVTVHTAQAAVPAAMLACDLSVDVAVLEVRTGGAGLAAAPPPSLSSGDDLLIAGRARATAAVRWTAVEEVGPAWRSRSGGELDRLIRLSPGLPRTLEGGATVDLEGRLVAMAVRGPRHQTLGIPRETIERIVVAVRRHGRLPQPYLGVRLQPVRLDEALGEQLSRSGPDGVIVVGVEPGSPAAAAPLLLGDLILSIDGKPVATAMDLKVALSRTPLGSPLAVQVHRAGTRLDATVVVRERHPR